VESKLLENLGGALPPGQVITSGEVQALWVSDGPVGDGVWTRCLAEHAAGSGLWPLLLLGSGGPEDGFRPWGTGEVYPERMSAPGGHDPGGLLASWWADYVGVPEDEDQLSPEARAAVTAPFGANWPGRAPHRVTDRDPDEVAVEFAQVLADQVPGARLGLVRADRGADAPAAAGWDGPVNYDSDTARYSAVLRDWERRFGARVVGLGFSTLHVSVAAPPLTEGESLRVAAEHFAFCPDTVWQGSAPYTLAAYAERIVGLNAWEFWWD
jgi:hypothetical protein